MNQLKTCAHKEMSTTQNVPFLRVLAKFLTIMHFFLQTTFSFSESKFLVEQNLKIQVHLAILFLLLLHQLQRRGDQIL